MRQASAKQKLQQSPKLAQAYVSLSKFNRQIIRQTRSLVQRLQNFYHLAKSVVRECVHD